jgi:F0F1-type ATP synthase assembly protein I
MNKKLPKIGNWSLLWQFFGIGFEVIIPPLLGAWGGSYLDGRFSSAPYLLIGGIVLGVLSSILLVYKKIKTIKNI